MMKIVKRSKDGSSREVLLKEYFINASLIALLKGVGQEAAKAAPSHLEIPILARVKQ